MYFYTTTLEPKTAPRKTPSCSQKTASRNFFSYPIKTSYKNRSNSLKTSLENPTYSHKLASGRSSWPSRDPIEEDGGVNLYAFVANEPMMRWDYLGYTVTGMINKDAYKKMKWHYSSHKLTFKICGCCPTASKLNSRDALKNFSAWDKGKIIAKIGVEKSTFKYRGRGRKQDIVGFDRKGGYGFMVSDFLGFFGGTASVHWVTLLGPGKITAGPKKGSSFDQRAITNEGHIIFGVRTWKASLSKELNLGKNDCNELVLFTEAYERGNNISGTVGYDLFSDEAEVIWTEYLKETAKVATAKLGCTKMKLIGIPEVKRDNWNTQEIINPLGPRGAIFRPY